MRHPRYPTVDRKPTDRELAQAVATAGAALTSADVGSAAYANTGDFATAAQGGKADSAVQSVTGTGVDNTDPKNPVIASGGVSLPLGGTIHQVLTKLSSTDGDADWETPSSGGGGGARYTYTNALFSNVSSLLHFEGSNGSTTITDQISGNAWAAAGATISTAWSSAGSSSLKTSSASTAMVSMTTNSKFNVGNGDWTLEMTVKYLGAPASYGTLFQTRSGAVYAGISLVFNDTATMLFSMSSDAASTDIIQFFFPCDVTQPAGASILIQRHGLVVTVAVNRVVVATQTVSNNNNVYYNAADKITVGGTPTRSANVYVDEFRFTKGQALLTFNGDFTPGTPPFPNS